MTEIVSKILEICDKRGYQELLAIIQLLEKRREVYKHESHMNGKVNESSPKMIKFNQINYIINSLYERAERDIFKLGE